MSNIIKVSFGNRREATASAQWQGDYGQILQFYGLKLPDTYEVHFANKPHDGQAKTQIGNADGVEIPAEYFVSGENIYAWIFLHTGADDGETEYMATIPIKRKPQPTGEPPTPQEQSVITQAIAALNEGVERVEDIADGIPATIEAALQEAKDSGEFDGKDGKDGKDGRDGKDGAAGASGQNGVTYTPSVSSAGVISWTNDGGLPNPPPQNVKGDKGDDGSAFVVTVTRDGTNYTADKTYAEIDAAVAAKLAIKAVLSDGGQDTEYQYIGKSGTGHDFTRAYIGAVSRMSISSTDAVNRGTLAYGTYSKPSGGIPKTDLASGVQSSLDKTEPLTVSFTLTSESGGVIDKTAAQVAEAFRQGKTVFFNGQTGSNELSLKATCLTTDENDDVSIAAYAIAEPDGILYDIFIPYGATNTFAFVAYDLNGGSGGIIDVAELPQENINDNAFYRIPLAKGVMDGRIRSFVTCICVDELPEEGIPVYQDDMEHATVYYSVSEDMAYAYADTIVAFVYSISEGWYPLSTMLPEMTGTDYGGVITRMDDAVEENTLYILLEPYILSHKAGRWTVCACPNPLRVEFEIYNLQSDPMYGYLNVPAEIIVNELELGREVVLHGAFGDYYATLKPTVWIEDGGYKMIQAIGMTDNGYLVTLIAMPGDYGEFWLYQYPLGSGGGSGQDGYSPTATVSKSGNTATISITDINGTTTAQIIDGTSAVWFTGTAIAGTGSRIPQTVNGSKMGDMYLNTLTCNVYKAFDTNIWEYWTNIKGTTPVKGTDYWTAADKASIVSDVLSALPTWTGGAY